VERLFEAIIEAILGLEGPIVYFIVGILSFLEAPMFLGLVTPGEFAMAGGGVLASRGQAAVGWVAVAAGVGTVLGNSVGFWLGRMWGVPILAWAPLQRWLGKPINRTQEFFQKRGEWAIVGGRFASFLRIFVPFIAGASGMKFGRFFLYDAPTGIVWGVAWVFGGFVLGESWGILREVAGPAAVLVLILAAFALLLRWVARAISAREERIQAAARRVLEIPVLRWIVRHFGDQLRWLGRRFDPGIARGLNLTIGFLFVIIGFGGAALVIEQTGAVKGLARIDFPALRWMSGVRTDEAVEIARNITSAFRPPGMIGVTTLAVVYTGWRLTPRAAARVAVGVLGSGFGALILDLFVIEGLVPRAEFPSPAVAVAAAVVVHATAVAGTQLEWARAVTIGAVGVFLIGLVGLSALVAGQAAPSGIALGAAIGVALSSLLEVQARVARMA
jgi:membrane protein DedA with SNARE-associated domain